MNSPKNIFLVGPMGTGKSTIGKQLAKLMRWTFDDTDHEIQRRTGVDIPTIFDYEGEAGFRRRECQVVEQLTAREGLVLATGGGVVLSEDNRRLLSSRGCVVYLCCSPEQQYRRTQMDRSRPLLQTEDPQQCLRNLFEQRDPLYREIADLVVSTERRGAMSVAREIIRRLELE